MFLPFPFLNIIAAPLDTCEVSITVRLLSSVRTIVAQKQSGQMHTYEGDFFKHCFAGKICDQLYTE